MRHITLNLRKMIHSKQVRWLFFVIVIVLCLRFVNIDADRPLPIFAHSNDEFYKSSGGIYKANFDTWLNDDENSGLIHAPLFAVVQYPILELFGVSLASTRIISAIGAVITVLLLYLMLRKENKKMAIFASFLLSINYVFFILGRVGIPNSFALSVLLFSFYIIFLNEKDKINYLVSGFVMGLAILLKANVIYIIVAAGIFLLIQKISKKIDFVHLVYYALGYSVTVIAYYFYTKSFPPEILEPMILLSKALSMHYLFFPRLIILFVDSIFKFPSIFLMSIATVAYFALQRFPKFSFKEVKDYFGNYSFSEKIAFSWLFGTIISVIFTSIIHRRIVTIIIPLVIYPSLLLFRRYNEEKEERRRLSIVNLIFPWLFSVSLFINLFIFVNEEGFSEIMRISAPLVPQPILSVIMQLLMNKSFILTLGMFTVFTLGVVVLYFKNKDKVSNWKGLKNWSIFCLVGLLTFGVIKFIYEDFIGNYELIPPIIVVIVSLLVSFIIFKSVLGDPIRATRRTIVIYTTYCLAAIILFTLIFPSFTVKEASEKIAEITDEGDYIIGYFSPGLSIESHTRPIFNKFLSPWREFVDYSIYEVYKPKLFLTSPIKYHPPSKEEVPHELGYVSTFNIAPLMTFGKPRMIIELYKIDYENNLTITQYI